VVALYIVYDSSRGLVGGGRGAAFSHARSVVSWERATSLNLERGVQTLASAVPGLMRLFGWGYMGLHLGATVAALLWLHRRRSSEAYVNLRTALLIASVVGLVGFVLFPTAPPRLAVTGVIDSVSHGAVNLNGSTLRWLYNPYAAMPSMHIAYATLVGYSLVRWGRRSWVRWLGGLYPSWVAVEVIATGNHFLLDILGGVLVAAAALIAASMFLSRREPIFT
jgi:membrane-associated phospholipid phosphatase